MRVGIIGCGFIGSELAKYVSRDKRFRLVAVHDIDEEKARKIAKIYNTKLEKLKNLTEKSDFIIESASKQAVNEILNQNIDKPGKRLLIMSTGGVISSLNKLNKLKKCQVYLPSGAISGLDAIKNASGLIKTLTLTTTKPLKGLEGAPYIVKNKINLKKLKTKRKIFDGNLKKAVEGFPKNINVAATLYLASKFKNMKIRIIADPKTRYNTHEIEAIGKFGKINTVTQNLPSRNPKTSYLALLSALQVLKSLNDNKKIGN